MEEPSDHLSNVCVFLYTVLHNSVKNNHSLDFTLTNILMGCKDIYQTFSCQKLQVLPKVFKMRNFLLGYNNRHCYFCQNISIPYKANPEVALTVFLPASGRVSRCPSV